MIPREEIKSFIQNSERVHRSELFSSEKRIIFHSMAGVRNGQVRILVVLHEQLTYYNLKDALKEFRFCAFLFVLQTWSS